MPKYLKEFETHAEYETYINSRSAILPNVSHCINNNDVHYNPRARLGAIYNVTDISQPTKIMNVSSNFSKMLIDDIKQPSVVASYQFDRTGKHIVKYTLADQTNILGYTFQNCTDLFSITIPNSVTRIARYAFDGCTGLTSVSFPNYLTIIEAFAFRGCRGLTSITIPNSVTSIGNSAFSGCRGLTNITIKAINPPTLINTVVFNNTNNCPIYVPSQSVEAYKTAPIWCNYYADRIFAITE